jgi:hypothetical protein
MVPFHMVPFHMVPFHMVPFHMVPVTVRGQKRYFCAPVVDGGTKE